MAKKTDKTKEENKLSLVVDFSGFVELPEGMTAEKRAEEIKAEIASLSIQTLDDKEHYKVGRKLLTDLVTLRTTIEKVRKDKKEPILSAGKRVDETAKTLTSLFQSLETDLATKVKAYEKLEEDEKNKEKIRNQERQKYLIDNHFPYNGENFVCSMADGCVLATITPRTIVLSNEVEWNTIVENIINPNAEKVRTEQEQIRIKEEEDRKAFEAFKATQAVSEVKEEVASVVSVQQTNVVNNEATLSVSDGAGFIKLVNESTNPITEKPSTEQVLRKVLALFKQFNPHGTAALQLEAIIKAEIEKL